MKVVIIKYNAGNIQSVSFALNRLGIDPVITDDFDQIRNADRVIFPGVGEASTTMKYLTESGLTELIPNLNQPVLGICLGMQLMCASSDEGNVKCLGIFDDPVIRFKPSEKHKIPHMGWSKIIDLQGSLFKGIEDSYVYFVHSYYVPLSENGIASTSYIETYTSALQKDNFFATQFHPEKSGKIGEQILTNFLNYDN